MSNNPKNYMICYVVIVVIYTVFFIAYNDFAVAPLDSSALGGFLSGLFAPLVFLYLILGHKQQEEALNKTNNDLLEQLNIQKQMLELQLADQKAREHAAQPILDAHFSVQDYPRDSKRINHETGRPYKTFQRRVTLDLTNSGEKVSQVNITCIKPFRKSMNFNRVLEESGKLISTLSINEGDLDYYNEDNFVNLEIELIYTTSLGLRYKITYEVQLSSLQENMHLAHGGFLNTVRCN